MKTPHAGIIVAIGALLLASPVGARDSQSVPEFARAALGKLPRSGSTDWQLSWDAAKGAPVSLFGSRTSPIIGASSDLPNAIRDFLVGNELFRFRPDLDDCRLFHQLEMKGIRHFRMEQTYRGLPVFDGSYNVAVDEQNRVVAVTGSMQPDLDGSTQVSMTSARAGQLARAAVPGGRIRKAAEVRLGIQVLGYTATPAFEVAVEGPSPADSWLIRVDARTGEILQRISQVAHYDGLANVFDIYPGPSSSHQVTLPRLDGSGTALQGENVEVHNLSGSDASGVNGDFRFAPSDTLNYAQAQAYYHADRWIAYLRSLGLPQPSPRVKVRVNDPEATGVPAYYYNFAKTVYISRGYRNAAYDAGVVVHEVQHFVSDILGFGAGPIGSQHSALQEALSIYSQASYTTDPEYNVWTAGIPASCQQQGYYPRSVENPDNVFGMPNYNQLLVCGVPSSDHRNAFIVAGALWNLRQDWIGAALTDQLVLEAIPFLPHPTTMGCFFDALLMADILFHNGDDMYPIVRVRVDRYLNCLPVSLVQGLTNINVGEEASFTVTQGFGDCGVVGFTPTLWERRPACITPPCAPWTSVGEEWSEVYATTESAPNKFDLRAHVMDTWGRTDITDVYRVSAWYPMTVAINGPSTVDISECAEYTWCAQVTGHGPFTYQWTSIYGNRTTQCATLIPFGSFTLQLTVTDADGQSKPTSLPITATGQCDGGIDPAPPGVAAFTAGSIVDGQRAQIMLRLNHRTHVSVEVVDVAGRKVAQPFAGWLEAGTRQVDWDTSTLPRGMYFYHAHLNGKTIAKRILILR